MFPILKRIGLKVAARAVADFVGPVPGAIKNHVNVEELARVAITALTSGGGLFGLLSAVALGAGTIFPAAGDSALAGVVLTAILEILRRLNHGDDLIPGNGTAPPLRLYPPKTA